MQQTRASKDFRNRLGKRIKYFRELRGIKQQDVASALGYDSNASVIYLESGGKHVTVEQALILGKLFDVSLEELLGHCANDIHPRRKRGRHTVAASAAS